ncbi:MAG TPA: DEAD/DEAH box helicase [Bacteroidota bacterium]|nr:DEAD/DEAH box helicase [Bacteroidota bacterium]
MNEHILHAFHPVVRSWFERTFGAPTPPQALGWEPISQGKSTLIVAPTGTGKTIAAFLWCINHLIEERLAAEVGEDASQSDGVGILYISPLKALNNDIHRNLEEPLAGIHAEAASAGLQIPRIRSAVRTGDTTQSERRSIITHPPDILITTPESLYLMLTSVQARKIFRTVRYVIVDEIHSLAPTKRGVHLSLSLERLEQIAYASPVRIGLSATQRPLEPISQFLAGSDARSDGTLIPRSVTIVDAGTRKEMDVRVRCVPIDFSDLPEGSVWPLIYPELIKAIGRHKTTLIFVNNRRLAERIAAKLNEILAGAEHTINLNAVPKYTDAMGRRRVDEQAEAAPPEVVIQAYHSSMSRPVREEMERELKAGRLKALVATSSLELGIDIGSVDLVIQIQSPKAIARGLQRIGRSGHIVHATSKGRLFPTHREDLVECAVIAREMLAYHIESTRIPLNCLDVLAQQIVAAVSIEEWNTDALYDLMRQSYCYRTLTRDMFLHVIEMLSGRYAGESFRDLRSRISFDRQHNLLSALPGSAHQAIMGAGTIPDRGYFGVYLSDKKTKIGDVDEEFIYESRTGDTFILGSNVWKMIEIDANRILVEPAPGQPARMPFWKGEGVGRTFELSTKIGEFRQLVSDRLTAVREMKLTDDDVESELQREYSLDRNAARNILDYLAQQQTATGAIPTHRRIVVEGFRDEIGDPRIVVHACFGRSINALLGIILKRSLQEQLGGVDVQMLYNDDGILFRCPDLERMPLDLFTPPIGAHEAQSAVIDELPSSPMFASLFRQNAERALLLPKALPGKRLPLWLQRLRAGDLLQIVRRSNDFPIVIETFRDCLNDVLDLEHFREVITGIESGEIDVHTIQRETASPFASSVLFEFIAVYMYEADKARSSKQHVPINADMLGEIVDLDTVSTVLSPEALEKIEEQLQYTAPTRRARSAAELYDIMLRLGELTEDELRARTGDVRFIEELEGRGSIERFVIGSRTFFIPAEERPLYTSAFTRTRRTGKTESASDLGRTQTSRTETVADTDALSLIDPLEARLLLAVRSLRARGIVEERFFGDRYEMTPEEYEQFLSLLEEQDDVMRGHFTSSEKNEVALRPNLERIRKASLALKRREITPASLPQFAEFLSHWQHRDPASTVKHEEGFRQILDQMIGLALPQEVWEPEIFARRMHPYDSQLLRRFAQTGELICAGNDTGKILWFWRGEGSYYLDTNTAAATEAALSPTAREVYRLLSERGALFLSDLRTQTVYTLAALNKSLAELFWAGLITNDSADEVLKIKRYRATEDPVFPDEKIALIAPARNPLRFAAARSVRAALRNAPGWNGRWSRLDQPGIMGPVVSLPERVRRQTEQLLIRYGIVAREVAKREANFVPWSLIAFELQRMEMRGEIRRGYFVEGLSGMQFALPEAYTLLQTLRSRTDAADRSLVINACDPALPYGQGIETMGMLRMPRVPQNFCALHHGAPLALFEQFGTRISTVADISEEAMHEALATFVSHIRSMLQRERTAITVEYCNDQKPTASPMEGALRAVGFYRDRVQTMRLDL